MSRDETDHNKVNTHTVGGGTLCGLCSSDLLVQEIVCDGSEVLMLSDLLFVLLSFIFFLKKSPDDRIFFFLCEPSHMCEDLLLSVTLASFKGLA